MSDVLFPLTEQSAVNHQVCTSVDIQRDLSPSNNRGERNCVSWCSQGYRSWWEINDRRHNNKKKKGARHKRNDASDWDDDIDYFFQWSILFGSKVRGYKVTTLFQGLNISVSITESPWWWWQFWCERSFSVRYSKGPSAIITRYVASVLQKSQCYVARHM